MSNNIQQEKEINETLKPIFKDMAKYAPSKLFGLLGNALIVPVYTNLLSREQYGIYTVSLAVLSFLCILFSDWVGLSGLRFFRQHQIKLEIPKYLSTLVMLLASNVLTMFLLAFLFKGYFYSFFKIPPKIFLIILILIIPVAIRALLFQILRAQIKPSAFTISTIANQIMTIVFSVLIIKYLHLGGISILLGMFVSISIFDVVLMFQSNIFEYFKFETPKLDTLKSLFIYGIPIAIASISMWAINQSNRFILRHFNGFEDVGLVGVAYGLSFPLLMTLFSIITVAAFPRIINMFEDKKDVRPVISRLTGYYLLVALPLVVLMALYSVEIVDIFANSRFINASVILPYLSISVLFMGLADYTTMQYHLANKMYINTILKVSAGGLGLVLYYFLIKYHGIVGVGIAALITNFVYFALSVVVTVDGLKWQVPWTRIFQLGLSFVPFGIIRAVFHKNPVLPPVYEMLILLAVYYFAYFVLSFVRVRRVGRIK